MLVKITMNTSLLKMNTFSTGLIIEVQSSIFLPFVDMILVVMMCIMLKQQFVFSLREDV